MIKLADILSGGIDNYLLTRKLSYKQAKVISKLINCFSETGKKVLFKCTCKECDYEEEKPGPCRDRHCNRCNNNKKIKWLLNVLKNYLSLPYFHIVFTIPSELNNLSICNQAVVYDILFKSSFHVLKSFSKDKKHFGGKLGFIGLLHTWGQTLNYHPHIHYMVLCGGIREGKFSKLPYSKDFIFPVPAMSEVMMGKFIELLKEKYLEGKLKFPGDLDSIKGKKEFNDFLYMLSKKKWVINSKPPFSNGERTLEYISRYSHKVAIANSRIKSYENGVVRFEYKNYRNTNKRGIPKKDILPLEEEEFIRRYLLHILPEGFRKIRYGGIFAANQKKESIDLIWECIKSELEKIKEKLEIIISELEEKVLCVCPKCESKVVICEYG
jgi:hypothetical protein